MSIMYFDHIHPPPDFQILLDPSLHRLSDIGKIYQAFEGWREYEHECVCFRHALCSLGWPGTCLAGLKLAMILLLPEYIDYRHMLPRSAQIGCFFFFLNKANQ